MVRRGQDILRGYVPIDTENLKRQVRGEFFQTATGIEIRFFVNNIDLSYSGKKRINAQTLALILNNGTGKGAIKLKRTRDNEFARQGQPVEKWFDKGMDRIEEEVNSMITDFDFSKFIK